MPRAFSISASLRSSRKTNAENFSNVTSWSRRISLVRFCDFLDTARRKAPIITRAKERHCCRSAAKRSAVTIAPSARRVVSQIPRGRMLL